MEHLSMFRYEKSIHNKRWDKTLPQLGLAVPTLHASHRVLVVV